MAWTAPRTWVAGEVLTAALLNTHVRDNENVLKASIDDLGHLNWFTVSKSSDYTIGTGDDLVFVTATKTMSLPASPATGKPFGIKSYGSTATVTVSGNGKLIDGSSSGFTLNPYDSAFFIYNGTEYSVF